MYRDLQSSISGTRVQQLCKCLSNQNCIAASTQHSAGSKHEVYTGACVRVKSLFTVATLTVEIIATSMGGCSTVDSTCSASQPAISPNRLTMMTLPL